MGLPDFVFDGTFSLSGTLWSFSDLAPDFCIDNKVAGAITTVTSVAVSLVAVSLVAAFLVAENPGGVSASDELFSDSEDVACSLLMDGAGEEIALDSKSGFLT